MVVGRGGGTEWGMEEVVAGWLGMCVMGWVGVGGGRWECYIELYCNILINLSVTIISWVKLTVSLSFFFFRY